MLTLLIVFSVLGAILSRPRIAKLLLGLLKDRKELALFVVFEAAAIGATALLLMAVGPQAGGYTLLGVVALFFMWVMKPPAKRR